MFNKILIANRGEIAVRIIRACRNLGIRSVAVYSKEDAKSLHVQLADQRICIGEGPARNSYLNMDRIIAAAENMGADAIHPGFGFLSENSEFVRKCKENGITFIGPDADVIDKMGNKSHARKTMMDAGVPVVPGTKEPVYDAYFSGCDRKAHMVQNRLFPEPFYDILYFYQIFHSLNPLCLQQIIYKPDSIASSVYVFDFFIMINPVTRIIAISTARIYHSGTASSLLK